MKLLGVLFTIFIVLLVSMIIKTRREYFDDTQTPRKDYYEYRKKFNSEPQTPTQLSEMNKNSDSSYMGAIQSGIYGTTGTDSSTVSSGAGLSGAGLNSFSYYIRSDSSPTLNFYTPII